MKKILVPLVILFFAGIFTATIILLAIDNGPTSGEVIDINKYKVDSIYYSHEQKWQTFWCYDVLLDDGKVVTGWYRTDNKLIGKELITGKITINRDKGEIIKAHLNKVDDKIYITYVTREYK